MTGRRWFGVTSAAGIFVVINGDAAIAQRLTEMPFDHIFFTGSTPVGTGTATLSWVKPTQNADGSALTDLAGFVLKYGNSPSTLTQRVAVNDPTMTRYTLQSLGKGTWYFTVVSYTVNGVESDVSQVVSKTIT